MSKFRRMLMMANVSEPVPPTPPPTPYIEWLKSLGCLTWLPLTEGDLEDKITETTLTLSGKGSMTWDSSVGMYKIVVPSAQWQYVGRLSNGLSASQFPNNAFTSLCTFQKVTSNSDFYAEQPCLISTNINTLSAISSVMYNGTSKSSSIPSGTHHFAKAYKSTERKFFYDGAVTGTYTGYAAHLPSNWVTTENGIDLGKRYNNVTYYMKDVYIFNTYLSLETIRQIQGYDPLPDGVIR